MTSYTETQITPSSGTSYFTARDIFKSIKHNGVLIIQSYINITTEIPKNTPFANIGLSNSDVVHGTLGFLKTDGSKVYPLSVASQGRLSANDSAIPTGYYYVIGAIIYNI